MATQRARKPKYKFFVEIEPSIEMDLTLILQKTEESKAEFLRRVIRNEINMLEGNYQDVKFNPKLITEEKLNHIIGELAHMRTKIESNEKHIHRQGELIQGTKETVNEMSLKTNDQTEKIYKKIDLNTIVVNKQLADGINAINAQMHTDIAAFNKKVDKSTAVSYLVIKVLYWLRNFIMWICKNVHKTTNEEFLRWSIEITPYTESNFEMQYNRMERHFEEGGFTEAIDYIKTEK